MADLLIENVDKMSTLIDQIKNNKHSESKLEEISVFKELSDAFYLGY